MNSICGDVGRDSFRYASLSVASLVISNLGKPRLEDGHQLIEGFVEVVWKKLVLPEYFDEVRSSGALLVFPLKRITYGFHSAFEGCARVHYGVLVLAMTIMLMGRQKLFFRA